MRARRNSFDAIRLLAALAVLVSHSFVFAHAGQPMVGTETLGTVAVLVFFGISGYLITQSWEREPRIGRFALKRALRIYPALLVVLALTVLVLGPFVTTLPAGDYFSVAQTWWYGIGRALMLTPHGLPGVFAHQPGGVNPSLWTLPGEVCAYVAVAILGAVGAYRRKAVYIVGLLVVSFAAEHLALGVTQVSFVCLRAFTVGAALYVFRDRLPLRVWVAVGLVVGVIGLSGSPVEIPLACIAFPYLAVAVAYRAPTLLSRVTDRGDLSYGVYLYAGPVGQAVALALGRSVTALYVIALSLPVTVALAAFSWRLVERPALRLKAGFQPSSPASGPSVGDAEAADAGADHAALSVG